MKLKALMGAAALVAGGSVLAATPKNEEACRNLSQFEDSVSQVTRITPQTTLGELKAVGTNIRDSYDKFVKSSERAAKPQTDNLKRMIDELARSARQIPENATLAQAHESLKPDIQQVEMAGNQLMAKLDCGHGGSPVEKQPSP